MADYALTIKSDKPKIIIGATLKDFLMPESIPNTVRELIFQDDFNGKIEPGVIPMGCQTVEFGNAFNQELKAGVFPISVTSIKFGANFNKSLENILPENLKVLHIKCYLYNHTLIGVFPLTLTEFKLAVSQITDCVPFGVTELNVYNYNVGIPYNFLIPGSIPNTVKKMIFQNFFVEQIEPGVIPEGTEIVEFGSHFNQQLKSGVFPNTVTDIKFGMSFNKSLENVLPENLKILYIGCYKYNHSLDDVLPPTIVDFQFAVCQSTISIPTSVTELYIHNENLSMYTFHPNRLDMGAIWWIY